MAHLQLPYNNHNCMAKPITCSPTGLTL